MQILTSRNPEPGARLPRVARRVLLAACAVGLLATAAAATEAPDGTVLGERPYTFPDYAEARGYTRFDGSRDAIEKYWSEAEYETAVSDEDYKFRKLLYASDGLRVVAYVLGPQQFTEPRPVIVFNRGSSWHHDLAPVLLPYMHRLAIAGYVVVAPMYRQTDGGEGIDANGGDDVNDLMNLLPVIEQIPSADDEQIYMTGESRGAMMVFQAIREGFPLQAAAVWGGYTNLQPLIDAQPMMAAYATEHWPGFDADDMAGNVRRRSVLHWPEAIDVPVLLMHGQHDGAIPVEHTFRLAMKLQDIGQTYGLIVFAGDDHVLSANRQERDRASVRWFRKFTDQDDN